MPAFSRHLPTLLAGLAVLAGAMLLLWNFTVQGSGILRSELAQLAGSGATDCGMVKLGADRAAAAACAQAALREGRPFRVAFRIKDAEARAAVGLARKAGGPVMKVFYRSEGWGGSQGLPSNAIEVEPCPNPAVSATAEKPVTCE